MENDRKISRAKNNRKYDGLCAVKTTRTNSGKKHLKNDSDGWNRIQF